MQQYAWHVMIIVIEEIEKDSMVEMQNTKKNGEMFEIFSNSTENVLSSIFFRTGETKSDQVK